MALREECEKQGNLLFRWRSYIPLVLILVILPAFQDYIKMDHTHDDLWEIGIFILALTGELIRTLTVGFVPRGTSGRVTKNQVAERLNTTGIYSTVRHPLYLANYVIWLGVFSFFRIWWLTVIISLFYFIYYERIMYAEEEFLRRKFGAEFERWASTTPAFIPSFTNYTPPDLPFSLRTVLKREHTSIFGIVSTFTILELLKRIFVYGDFNLSLFWKIVFIFGAVQYLIIFILKKFTHLLEVEGR